MLMYIYSCAKANPVFFSCLVLFANTETLEQTSEVNKMRFWVLILLISISCVAIYCQYLLS